MVLAISDLRYKNNQEYEDCKEVTLEGKLPTVIEESYDLNNYELTVRLYKNGDKEVLVYDKDSEMHRFNIEFNIEAEKKIFEFAERC